MICSFTLNAKDVRQLSRTQRSAKRALEAAGWLPSAVDQALQPNINDAFERRSAACAYEQERARRIVLTVGGTAFFSSNALCICIGNPRCNRPLGELDTVDLRAILRKWKDLISALGKQGWRVKGVAVVEIHLVKPLDGPAYWEPHIHGILEGAPGDAVRALCRVRPIASSPYGRKRHSNVKPVSDLAGALGYATKFLPQNTYQYVGVKGRSWDDNDLRGEALAEWTSWMAQHTLADLLTYRGIDLRQIGLASTSEMATQYRLKGQILP